MDEVKSVGLFLFLDCFSIFSFINLQYSNKYLGGSQYCFLLKETVSCKRLCQQEVMGICEEFGSFNEMRLDTGVCFHICNDSSIGLPQSHTHEHTQTPRHTQTPYIQNRAHHPTLNGQCCYSISCSVYTQTTYYLKYFYKNINLVYLGLHLLHGHTG